MRECRGQFQLDLGMAAQAEGAERFAQQGLAARTVGLMARRARLLDQRRVDHGRARGRNDAVVARGAQGVGVVLQQSLAVGTVRGVAGGAGPILDRGMPDRLRERDLVVAFQAQPAFAGGQHCLLRTAVGRVAGRALPVLGRLVGELRFAGRIVMALDAQAGHGLAERQLAVGARRVARRAVTVDDRRMLHGMQQPRQRRTVGIVARHAAGQRFVAVVRARATFSRPGLGEA